LQWATYRDASDQCSLSRIWGGIHPPADDIPGRLIGEKIGQDAFLFAVPYFSRFDEGDELPLIVYPNPASSTDILTIANTESEMSFQILDIQGKTIPFTVQGYNSNLNCTIIKINQIPAGIYIINSGDKTWKLIVM